MRRRRNSVHNKEQDGTFMNEPKKWKRLRILSFSFCCCSTYVMFNLCQPRGLQQARLLCPPLSPGFCSNSCPLSQWCHSTISFSVSHFSFCCQSFPVFSNELALYIRWPKYWNFSFSISPSKEYSVFISFSIDGFDLLAIQGILKSLLQHYNSKASILQWPAFFMVQLSHPYMTTGKTTALTRRIFLSKVMFLLFNMLSRLVIAFLPRSKRFFNWTLLEPSFGVPGGSVVLQWKL